MAKELRPFDYTYLAIVSAIALFGMMMLASASAPVGYAQFSDSYYFVIHQLVFGFLPGLAGMIILSRIPYTIWKQNAWNLLVVSIGLLVVVFLPGVSAGIGSAHSWISVGGLFSLQPSEIVKLTFLFYLSAWLEKRGEAGVRDMQGGFIPFLMSLGIILLLLFLQPDVGTMTIIAATSLAVYFVAGARLAYVGGLIAAGIASLGLLIGLAPYRAARFTTFLNPELDPQGIGYHINQALLAIGSGGILGVGYGHSRQKFQYLPEVAGDSIFAVIGEEMGMIVAMLVLVAFLAFLWRTLKIANESPDRFGKFVATGIGFWVVIQAFVNIGSMVAIMPMTGIPLPLISYGGTSMAVTMWAVGVVLNISRHGKGKE